MVDYSKWDKLASDVSDEEKRGQPRVTTLRKPQSVTIGKDGYSFGPVQAEKAAKPSKPANAKPSKPANARPGALDYSKWDHIGDDDSDCDDGSGDYDDEEDVDAGGYTEAPSRTLPTAVAASAAPPVAKAPLTLTETIKLLSRDGSHTAAYVWSQDRREVIVNVFLPPKATAKEVRVSVDQRILVTHAGAKIVDGKLAYECKPFEGATASASARAT
jgi:hypothetical protein